MGWRHAVAPLEVLKIHHALAVEQVGKRALLAAGLRRAVDLDVQVVAGGALQHPFGEVVHLLVVAVEEVDHQSL